MIEPYWLISGWAIVCAVYDLSVRRLPNFLTLGAHGVAIAIALISGTSVLGVPVASCLSAWGLAIALTLPAYGWKMLGAGDVKLLAAMGLMGGVDVLLMTYVIASFVMGTIVIGHVVKKKIHNASGRRCNEVNEKRRVLPFGFGFAVGYVSALLIWRMPLPV